MLYDRFLLQPEDEVLETRLHELAPVADRSAAAELPTGLRTTAAYDGDGKRRGYADSAGFRGFLWDGENIAHETDGVGATVTAYRYAPSTYGALLSQRRSGATSFHHHDALGSTMQLTDASQTPTDSYLYRAFGEQSVLSGSTPNPFTWVGRLGYYRQPDTSDYWVRARVYGPAMGRWVSRDILLHANQFHYALNSPLSLPDPSGLAPVQTPPPQGVVPPPVGTDGSWMDQLLELAEGAPGAVARALAWLAGAAPKGLPWVAAVAGFATCDSTGEEVWVDEEVLHWRDPKEDRCRGKCREKHPKWPTCWHTTDPGRAAMGRPRDRTVDDIVSRWLWKPVRPGRVQRTSPYKWCQDATGDFIGNHDKAKHHIVSVQFTEIGKHRRRPRPDGTPENGVRSFSVVCCPCCTVNSNESSQCWNWHDSGYNKEARRRQPRLD